MLEHDQSELKVAAEPESLKPAVVSFNPDLIVRAICYHLLDDHHATKVAAISIQQTRDRLRRQRVSLMMARRQWESLSNRERLEWLLGQSKTQTLYAGDTATLAVQK